MLLSRFSSRLHHLKMPALFEEIASNAASTLPAKLWFAVLGVTVITTIIGYILPLQLAHVLAAVMIECKEIYDATHEIGLRTYQNRNGCISTIVQETVRSSESWRATIHYILRGRAFVLFYRIYEVKNVE
ncbi:hypothetical protein MSAN_00904800 [Mycena sanguinolenta]|uniref:Uncharacterized protein n=1 Tax=Mycena sanguinolenta TaxID=230812 RepID=A0A8H7DBB2_9AGAR|nr:hypothetical protein MSAN_00904800 [Mycena sanguinolenta]